jgi:hypothetical protein
MAITFNVTSGNLGLLLYPFSRFRLEPDDKKTDFHFFKIAPDRWQCNDRQAVKPFDSPPLWFQGTGATREEAYLNCALERTQYTLNIKPYQ